MIILKTEKRIQMRLYTRNILLAAALCFSVGTMAQENRDRKITITGSIQSDILIPQDDEKIGTGKYEGDLLTNTYADVSVQSKYVDAGLRLEYLEHPLPGFEPDFKGWGLGNIYAKIHTDNFELTLGNFYEQFGSGFILRTYEERSLGIDNSLMGARAVVRPFRGMTLKALTGVQRNYWDYNDALVSGGDVELNLDEWIKPLRDKSTYLMLGASFVNKHEGKDDIMVDATHKLNLPRNVNAFDVRAMLQTGGLRLLGEYAWKSQDPTFDNGYIYRNGTVAMLSASYSKSGMSLLLQAKRSDNMSFNSTRYEHGLSSTINHLPAFAMDHTYTLAALYPYATRPNGEWAYQATMGYKFKRKTLLGGKYGTNVKLNFSYIRSINRTVSGTGAAGSDGYDSSFWKWGSDTYYQDLNMQIEKKLSRAFTLNLMYMNQFYNKTAVEGEGGMIHSDIFVAEGKYKINKKMTLRAEAQYLSTAEDLGDWVFGLLELSLLPNWMISVSDEYNCGETNIHYYQGSVTFNKNSHRIQLGYGRTREGFNCSGGVCRYVPASRGVTISYNYNF